MHRLDETAARDRQSILLLEEGGDLAVRQAELFIENDGEGHRLRTQLCGRGAERIRRLERMPALDTTSAPATPSDADVKGPDDDPWDRQLFLVLHRHPGLDDAITAPGTAPRQRRRTRLIDARGHAPTGLATIGIARLASRAFRMLRQRFRKRRRLASARPAGRVELSLQMVDLLSQSLVLSAQDVSLALRAFGALANRVDLFARDCRIGRPLIRHVDVMPDPPKKYKYGILDRLFNEAGRNARTR